MTFASRRWKKILLMKLPMPSPKNGQPEVRPMTMTEKQRKRIERESQGGKFIPRSIGVQPFPESEEEKAEREATEPEAAPENPAALSPVPRIGRLVTDEEYKRIYPESKLRFHR
jgi:hypothetical protein